MTRFLRPRAASNARRVFFTVHLWLGLVIGAWFVLIGLTGSVAAWLPQLVPLELKARFPFERAPGAPMIQPGAALRAFRVAHPELADEDVFFLGAPQGQFSHYYGLVPRGDDMDVAWIDPYSARVHAPMAVESLTTGWITHLHASLLSGPRGLLINNIGAALGVLILSTGLWLWWPSNLRQLRARLLPNPQSSGRKRLVEWHNVAGAYLFAPLFITTLTGALLAFNSRSDGALEKRVNALTRQIAPASLQVEPRGGRQNLDVLVGNAQNQLAGYTLSELELPTEPKAPLVLEFHRAGLLGEARATLDPYSGKVLRIERDRVATAGRRMVALGWDLHYGIFGGVATQLIYTLAGLMPLGLYVTGLLMWWKRLSARKLGNESKLIVRDLSRVTLDKRR